MEPIDSDERLEISGDKADGNVFNGEGGTEELQCSRLISEMLREEYTQDYKLDPSKVAMNNLPRREFPFNRHTVTIGIGNVVIDYEKTRQEHEKIREEQTKFADEIEKVKEEMEKVRIIEKAWYDDYLNETYINDLSAGINSNISHRIGDACAPAPYIKKIEEQIDKHGILHVRDQDSIPAVKPKGRYLVPFSECVESLPKVSL